jgi:hypothetical protein
LIRGTGHRPQEPDPPKLGQEVIGRLLRSLPARVGDRVGAQRLLTGLIFTGSRDRRTPDEHLREARQDRADPIAASPSMISTSCPAAARRDARISASVLFLEAGGPVSQVAPRRGVPDGEPGYRNPRYPCSISRVDASILRDACRPALREVSIGSFSHLNIFDARGVTIARMTLPFPVRDAGPATRNGSSLS